MAHGTGRLAALVVIGCSSALVGWSAPWLAADVEILGNHKTGTHDCKGGVASVMGNNNTLTFKNASNVKVTGNSNKVTLGENCPALEVMGNNNNVHAGRAKSINLMGNKNTITYQVGPKGETPKISNLGHDNKVDKTK